MWLRVVNLHLVEVVDIIELIEQRIIILAEQTRKEIRMSSPPPPQPPDDPSFSERGYYAPSPYNAPGAQPVYPAYGAPQESLDVQNAAVTALALEIIFGLFGILGVGHAYTGRLALGIALFIGWLVILSVFAGVSLATLGFALCLIAPITIAVPIISGIQARTYARRVRATGNWGAVAGLAGGGCLLIIALITVVALFFGAAITGALQSMQR